MEKSRIDHLLVEKGFVSTRAQALSIIKAKKVFCNGVLVEKAGLRCSAVDDIVINDDVYVSRGAYKIIAALDHYQVKVSGKIWGDIGASTGGFTQVLVERGAAKVYAIDVGHDQLHPILRENVKVVNMERTNIRDVQALPEQLDGAVMDLSHISLKLVVDHVFNLLKPGAFILALIKPQFEAGLKNIGKGGIVRDDEARTLVLQDLVSFFKTHGKVKVSEPISSPIEGKAGNQEFLIQLQYLG
jgi:23S rRNA (cytidine1920-2'-O)/16S rRNA (cytidine1409-2'-O)-methyltransferase